MGLGDDPERVVLRLGHRPGRDRRMTTHVGLTARALGADRLVIAGEAGAEKASIDDVTERFGGGFEVEVTDAPGALLRDWPGLIAHLTMYGEPIRSIEADIRRGHRDDGRSLLIVVGAEKVPFDVYEQADWNVAVTNQPHSEVAGLAVFLDRLLEGEELDRTFPGGTHRVVPMSRGKRVEPGDGEGASSNDDEHRRPSGI